MDSSLDILAWPCSTDYQSYYVVSQHLVELSQPKKTIFFYFKELIKFALCFTSIVGKWKGFSGKHSCSTTVRSRVLFLFSYHQHLKKILIYHIWSQ